jgi:hypothetical protein
MSQGRNVFTAGNGELVIDTQVPILCGIGDLRENTDVRFAVHASEEAAGLPPFL